MKLGKKIELFTKKNHKHFPIKPGSYRITPASYISSTKDIVLPALFFINLLYCL